jgi:hypothetical protein
MMLTTSCVNAADVPAGLALAVALALAAVLGLVLLALLVAVLEGLVDVGLRLLSDLAHRWRQRRGVAAPRQSLRWWQRRR